MLECGATEGNSVPLCWANRVDPYTDLRSHVALALEDGNYRLVILQSALAGRKPALRRAVFRYPVHLSANRLHYPEIFSVQH